jgi:hypothetical protein
MTATNASIPRAIDNADSKTKVRPMPSFTVKLPVELDRKLRNAARRRRESLSALARRALEREVDAGGPDFATVAAAQFGMFRGPGDLSAREGYGPRR